MLEKAIEEDLDEILNIINEVMFSSFKHFVPKEHIRNLIITYDDFSEIYNQIIFFVYRIKGKICGVAGLEILNNKKGLLRYVYILPKHQQTGIGTKLVKKIEEIAIKEGLTKLSLFTLEQAKWAIDFYLKLDYKLIETRESEMGKYVVMEKEI
ncbi:MAG: GNAT family N-acetyltransferase [Candidatus Heimdallarchaeota archaeon]|nr:GNAT family N-acetyltransferase [Candidatus Heimdallarchaeota archaeon]